MSPSSHAASAPEAETPSLGAFLSRFLNPPSELRPMPLWTWNGEMTEARITEMLEQFAAEGMGGVYVHPRPGLITEYLSRRWFELWNFALSECRRLGLLCNIYDENSYPSGFAGGHVPAKLPGAALQYLDATLHKIAPVTLQGELLAAYAIEAGAAVRLPADADLQAAITRAPVLTLELRRAAGNPWNGGFPYVDLLRPEVAKAFLETTYEPYAERFASEFGRTITSIFTDEPLLGQGTNGYCPFGLVMSRHLFAEFRRDHGYELSDRLLDLVFDSPEATATRFDYFCTVQRLYTRNFLEPLQRWCETRGLRFTGHFMEHTWPEPFFQPNSMHAFRWFSWPGIDLLAPQFDFTAPETSAPLLLTVREVASAAAQLGKERVMCETHGVGGYEATPEEFKRLSDWLMVHGVDFPVPHLAFQTICGARKYDHPQTFSDHSPWWSDYRPHADHMSRLSVALTHGRRIARVLVLHPTTTGWIRANPLSPRRLPETVREEPDPIPTLREKQSRLIQFLCDSQTDFDLGDELLMAEFAGVVPPDSAETPVRLRVGERSYDCIVLPEGMENWCESTLQLIREYVRAGGEVIALGSPPAFIRGRADDRPSALPTDFPTRWVQVSSLEQLKTELAVRIRPLVSTPEGRPLPALVGYQARRLPGGELLHLFVNSGSEEVSEEVTLSGSAVRELDTVTGHVHRLRQTSDGQRVTARLRLPRAGAALWIASPPTETASTSLGTEITHILEPADTQSLTAFDSIESAEPNQLALVYCDLRVGESLHPGLYVTQANKLCWQAHGYDADPWDRAVQFGRTYLEKEFPDSGFTATFAVDVGEDLLAQSAVREFLELAVERPELYEVRVNGEIVSFEEGRRWLDETILATPVGDALQPGRNLIALHASPFHPLCEIAPIYLLGPFSALPAETGFRLVRRQLLKLGNWIEQGLAMYSGAVRYRTSFTLQQPAAGLRLWPDKWAGSVIRVLLDDVPAGSILFPPYELTIDQPISAGRHELALEVVGTPKNLLGPHFCTAPLAGRWTTPAAWDEAPPTPPPGCAYELLPYGLFGPVNVSALK